MNILVLTSSPRRSGNTHRMAEAFARGASRAGHAVESFDLAHANIAACLACDACRRNGGACVQKDGMLELAPRLLAADAVAFATPLYYYGMSAQLKTAIDRFYALNDRLLGSGKKAVLLAACADEAEASMRPLVEHYRAVCAYLRWENAGEALATGVWNAGDVDKTDALERAEKLGASL